MEQKDVELPGTIPALCLEKHVAYIKNWAEGKEAFEYAMSEYLRMSGVYWCLTAMDISNARDSLDLEHIASWVLTCRHDDGGFSADPKHDSHILYTLSAIQILQTLDKMTSDIAEGVAKFIASQQQEDGSFQGDKWGEIDTRFSFCALAGLALVKKLDAVDVEKAADFIARCMNFDGGFGVVPGSESHAGQIYCCVGSLKILDKLDKVDADLLGWWLAERQLPSGGFNGRPEKLPDLCYSWWVLTSLRMIGRQHWINSDHLTQFIMCCQDIEDGGFADRPGDMVDPFHTLFGIAGLSLLGTTTQGKLKEINPIFCMAEEVIVRVLGEDSSFTNVNPVC